MNRSMGLLFAVGFCMACGGPATHEQEPEELKAVGQESSTVKFKDCPTLGQTCQYKDATIGYVCM